MSSEVNQPRRASRRNRRPAEQIDDQAAQREVAERRRQEAIEQRRREAMLRGRPANENDAFAASSLSAIRRRTSTTPIWTAVAVSMVWLMIWIILYVPALAQLGNPFAIENMPLTTRTLMVAFVPVAGFFAIGYLIYRANQMNNVSQALMQTAMRLVRPQDIATESLSSVSQMVRREVDQLVGGVEHAVQRASELEGVIHKEMANIERAFGANEERIRLMLEGLERQRNALHETGMVIGNEAQPLLGRLEENTQGLSGIIASASSTLSALEHNLKNTTAELASTVDEISNRANFVGTEISGQTARMEQMSGTLVSEMRLFSDNVSTQVASMQDTTQRLNSEGLQFGDNLRMLETSISEAIRDSMNELRTTRSEVTGGIEQLTTSMTEQLRAAAELNSDMMKTAGDSVTGSVRSTSAEIVQSLEASTSGIGERIQAIASQVDTASAETLRAVESSSESVTSQLRAISEENAALISSAGERVTQAVKSTSGNVVTTMQDTSDAIVGQLKTVGDDVAQSVQVTSEVVLRNLNEIGTEVTDRVQTASSTVVDNLRTTGDSL
ncbi:MAG: hypothetical protein R3287_14140, partial [Anderseniella sp.]|nr:hypothetical protein [Anderseniella sp.]